MSQRPPDSNPFDPFAPWRTLRDANLETWSKLVSEVLNSEAYNQAASTWLNAYLTTSQPLQQVVERTMTQVLTQLNMPTRDDVVSLAERLTNIELRLDDLDAKLDGLQASAQQANPFGAPEPTAQGSEEY